MTTSVENLPLPTIGLGCWSLNGSSGAAAVRTAIDAGYRLLDGAYIYENEGAVGRGIRDSGIDRDELIITSKLGGRFQQPGQARTAIEESIYRLGLDHLDLYLIHWPLPQRGFAVDAWQQLIQAKEDGLVRHIGVSNFLPEHIDELIAATGVVPEVNQVELHPLNAQQTTRAYAAEHGIQIEAWSPLGRGEVLENPTLVDLAAREELTVGELTLAWHSAIGSVPLARSTNPERQQRNLAAVDKQLSPDTVAAITALGAEETYLWGQDPLTYEEW